jgi:DNA-binding NarL/FixJ family response regulator
MSSKTILVMDDSPIVLEVVAAAFDERGWTVGTASNLAELEGLLATKAPPDLVVLDVQMPEIFGDDVAQVLRHVRSLKAPIVLFSSLDPSQLASRTAEAAVEGYVCKDDGVGVLVQRVEELLAARSAG